MIRVWDRAMVPASIYTARLFGSLADSTATVELGQALACGAKVRILD
jgi:hypothetical protein